MPLGIELVKEELGYYTGLWRVKSIRKRELGLGFEFLQVQLLSSRRFRTLRPRFGLSPQHALKVSAMHVKLSKLPQ